MIDDHIGALLVTSLPSELGAIGFQDGVHFVGYRKKQEITGLVRAYLANDRARRTIAAAGQELVLIARVWGRRTSGQIRNRLARAAGLDGSKA